MQANTESEVCTVLRTGPTENLPYNHINSSVHHTNILLGWSSWFNSIQ